MIWFNLPPVSIQPYFEYRERYERRNNLSFDSYANNNRSDLFSRWRPGLNLRTKGNWSGEVQYQYSHDLYWTPKANASIENSNLSLGYVRFADKRLTATAGRQKITLGDMRLVGPAEWLNVPRSFDGADARWRNWEAFGFAIAVNRVPDARLGGLVDYHKDGYTALLFKHDHPGTGEVDEYTLDEYCNHSLGNWNVHFEAAGQVGRAKHLLEDAFAGHLKIDRTIQKGWNLYGEGNIASGGPRPATRIRSTTSIRAITTSTV